MAGSASTSGKYALGRCHPADYLRAGLSKLLASAILLTISGIGLGQSLYKYRGSDGEWVYTDRAPEKVSRAEIRELPTGIDAPEVSVAHRAVGGEIRLLATNEFYAPIELVLALDALENVNLPPPEQPMRWVLPPRSQTELLQLDAVDNAGAPRIGYRFMYLHGDPEARHRVDRPYRAPFALAKKFVVSQAYPVGMTHNTADSYFAVDIAMPIGTDIYAARKGTVFEVASTNYRAGPDPEEEGASANLISILHDDGTIGVYAHLNWNTIRVRPGDEVNRGEYIADSGNTGYSTGPHLHFVVLRNRGLSVESLPIVFEGPNESEVTPQAGRQLIAH
jgi:murein DD-endopeptidase MepM/ murein hydrolase activator NlpD